MAFVDRLDMMDHPLYKLTSMRPHHWHGHDEIFLRLKGELIFQHCCICLNNISVLRMAKSGGCVCTAYACVACVQEMIRVNNHQGGVVVKCPSCRLMYPFINLVTGEPINERTAIIEAVIDVEQDIPG